MSLESAKKSLQLAVHDLGEELSFAITNFDDCEQQIQNLEVAIFGYRKARDITQEEVAVNTARLATHIHDVFASSANPHTLEACLVEAIDLLGGYLKDLRRIRIRDQNEQ